MLPPLSSQFQKNAVDSAVLYGPVLAATQCYKSGISLQRAQGVCDFLVKQGWFRRCEVGICPPVYTLTGAGLYACGLSTNRAKWPSVQTLLARVPLGMDCSSRRADVYTPGEMADGCLAAFAASAGFFGPGVEAESVFFVVDQGKEPRRLARKANAALRKFAVAAPDLVAGRRLGVRVLCPSGGKRDQLLRALALDPPPLGGGVEAGVVSVLAGMLLNRRLR